MAQGQWKDAIGMFTEVNQYKDAMEQLLVCFDKMHTPYRWMTTNNGAVRNTGVNNGYSGDA